MQKNVSQNNQQTPKKDLITASQQSDNFVIPDLCKINAVLFLLILTQLLALVLCLVNSDGELISWDKLGLLSIYCHSLVLSFAALICTTRRFLFGKSARLISIYFLGSNALITLIYGYLGAKILLPGVVSHLDLFLAKSLLISSMLASILLRYFFLQHQWREQKQAELRARIQALQARIRPHFLFNSMNSIASLISIDPDKAEDAVLDLSTIFRATLNNQASLIPFNEEIELCRRYLNIEALRLGKRLKIDWQLADCQDKVLIPPLSLQPLVENAIYHGIQPLTEGGTISIRSDIKQGFLYILISNPVDENKPKHSGNHIALDNIRSRLQAIFGEGAILKTSQLNQVFTVTLRIPKG
jgi:two-component system sensor histidine kinase AlgZ